MYRSKEEARQEGIRLLEVHVKLLREARAALRSLSTASVNVTSNYKKREDRLLDEIEKVEQRIEAWRKAYEDEYLQGNSIWDIIRKEEAEQNRKTDQKTKEEKEEKGRTTKHHSKKLKECAKCNTESIILGSKEEEKDEEGKEVQITEEKEQKTCINKQSKMDKSPEKENEKEEKEIMSQELDVKQVIEKQEANEALPSQDEGSTLKRLLEETDEEEEENVKRRKVISPDGSVPRHIEGHRVLVQNLPLTVQYNELRTYFMQFGTINKVFLKTGSGCGFVIYDSEHIADLVCALQHHLGNHEVKVVKDTPRSTSLPCPEPNNQDFEVFVFGVPPGTDSQLIRSALSSFGPVARVTQPNGKNYAFVGFESESSKEAALQARTVTFNSGTVIIRRIRTYSDEGKTTRKVETAKEEGVIGPERPKKGYQVFVFGVNIPMDLNGFKLGLAKFGTVVSAYMPEDKNYAFVGFETEESQQAALDAGSVNLPYGRAGIKPVSRK